MPRLLFVLILASMLAPSFRGGDAGDERQKRIDGNRVPIDWSAPKTRVLPFEERIDTSSGEQTRAGGIAFPIRYDTGTVTALPVVGSVTYGNRFDTLHGVPLSYGCTLWTVQFYMAGVGGSQVFLSLFGPPAGTVAPLIVSRLVTAATGFNTIVLSQQLTADSFLLGIWADASPIADLVGLDSGTAGHGHHGMIINDVVGTGFQSLPGINAIVRPAVTLFPVELLSFTVDEP